MSAEITKYAVVYTPEDDNIERREDFIDYSNAVACAIARGVPIENIIEYTEYIPDPSEGI